MRFDQRQNELVQQLANTRSLPPRPIFWCIESNRHGNHTKTGQETSRNLNMETSRSSCKDCKGRDQGPVNGHCHIGSNGRPKLAQPISGQFISISALPRWKQSSENPPRGADCKAISPLPSGLYRLYVSFLSICFHRVFLHIFALNILNVFWM